MHSDALALQMRATVDGVDPDRVLATVTYGYAQHAARFSPLGVVQLPVLSDARVVHAVWAVDGPFEAGARGRLRYRHNQHVLLGYIAVDESDFPACAGIGSIQQATQAVYAAIFDAIDRAGFANLVRCWNYLPRINECEDGLERYRQFNIGRKDAFDGAHRTCPTRAPSACALGTPGGQLIVHFLASNVEPRAIENPRQVSAYHYPGRYGPRSPTFSRATLLELPATTALFISGTASIVGHQSVHVGDVAAQAAETLRNLDAVVEQANLVRARGGGFSMPSLCLQGFLRHAGDREAAAAVLHKTLGDRADVTWFQADICRADLLVEIEGFGFC